MERNGLFGGTEERRGEGLFMQKIRKKEKKEVRKLKARRGVEVGVVLS